MTWTVTEHVEPAFEKVGRVYIRGEDMVVRSDLDSRGFRVPLPDLARAINGEPQPVRLLSTGMVAGTVRRSFSGKALNFTIEPFYYTTPLQSVTRLLAGKQRKAPLFVGRTQVEPG
ncbi:MAG TPA: hypothetical protein PLN56_06445 [Methanoregulaceae archaeon]|nr:MAG: hypothetical protein IPI71_09715 [Methanolinea sp.]HON81876.1 hypothetical protein [Methanoregulaceae archaeon]HPD10617.1 hypothetical protein [Methanoregulaceae archaeon]HRT15749.1 hypothetical protein [Methanoregulaceae archaeon]HRU31263.1 hypothetical protein [Methanoregulaceae archaeon]